MNCEIEVEVLLSCCMEPNIWSHVNHIYYVKIIFLPAHKPQYISFSYIYMVIDPTKSSFTYLIVAQGSTKGYNIPASYCHFFEPGVKK